MRRAVTLVELIIVIVILGIIAALAMPRLSQAATSDPESELRGRLQVLRIAIDRFQQDHNGMLPGGPDCDGSLLIRQLCGRTDQHGQPCEPGADGALGPYLQAMPQNPLYREADAAGVAAARNEAGGWLFDCRTGYVQANVDGSDASGLAYRDY